MALNSSNDGLTLCHRDRLVTVITLRRGLVRLHMGQPLLHSHLAQARPMAMAAVVMCKQCCRQPAQPIAVKWVSGWLGTTNGYGRTLWGLRCRVSEPPASRKPAAQPNQSMPHVTTSLPKSLQTEPVKISPYS